VLHASQPQPPQASTWHTPAAELTRQRLIRAALELFTTRGYHDTTTAHIAKKAGIAEGTIYRHFASKQQLVNELYRAAQRWAAKLVERTARDPETPGARAQLSAVAHGLVEGAVHDTAVVKLGLLERLDPVLDDESRKTAREFRSALERIVAEGKAQGTVRAGTVEIWAAVWLATVRYAVARVIADDWKPGDTGVRLVIDAAWRAISA
jgi:AcrR family transcriptional regulator